MRSLIVLKIISAFCIFLICFGLQAQNKSSSKEPFIRIYNLEGQKVLKGRVVNVTNSTITVIRGNEKREMNVSEVGFIRTKHSVGHNVLIGASAASAIAAVTFAAEADPDAWIFGYTAGEGILAGFILGAPVGGGIGALTALFKKSREYEINGESTKWMEIMPLFQEQSAQE